MFLDGKFKARIKARLNEIEKIAETKTFHFKRKEKDWVDVKIDEKTKRIDVTLRVNLRDGGEIGTEKDCYKTGSGSYAPVTKHCPWDKIPEKDLIPSIPPIQKRNKSNNFEALKQMALGGINTYWSRRSPKTKGREKTTTMIDGKSYDIIVNAVQDKDGMKAPKIIYFTNSKETRFTRSHNWEFSRKLFYKIGYLKDDGIWTYTAEKDVNLDFIETSAHEIGHQILLVYGGQQYSKRHKKSSTLGQDYLPDTPYPEKGEIDLMKYYYDYKPENFYARVIASKKDVLSLIWLTKIKIK